MGLKICQWELGKLKCKEEREREKERETLKERRKKAGRNISTNKG